MACILSERFSYSVLFTRKFPYRSKHFQGLRYFLLLALRDIVTIVFISQGGLSWVYHFFIYLFICWSNRMAALFLCYHSIALCTSKDNISASTICCLLRFINLLLYSQASIGFSCYLGGLSCSLHFSLYSLCCNMLTANDSEVVD